MKLARTSATAATSLAKALLVYPSAEHYEHSPGNLLVAARLASPQDVNTEPETLEVPHSQCVSV